MVQMHDARNLCKRMLLAVWWSFQVGEKFYDLKDAEMIMSYK